MGNTSSCSGCSSSNAVKLYYYPCNGPILNGSQLIVDNYNFITNYSFSVSGQEIAVTFPLGGEYDGLYIAFVAENACFTLRKLRVSYRVCLTKTVGLVVYPETPIGHGGVTSLASCKANAGVSQGGSLSFICYPIGTFSGSPSCSCLGGHIQSGEACYREIVLYF